MPATRTPVPDIMIDELRKSWELRRTSIEERLNDFRKIWETADDNALFAELAFCLFTPQSKARSCAAAVQTLATRNLLLTGTADEIARNMGGVRFHHTKARSLIKARELFTHDGSLHIRTAIMQYPTARLKRQWLVDNVHGFGLKEASHFLRNIGLGEDLAILDRHILKNILRLGVLRSIPSSLTPRRYLLVEKKLIRFAGRLLIPPAHLDLLFWCNETGEIFK